ncbi:MAG: cold shock domain-containing protein [Alphaproteobacteria bacterium]|nr:cold shock domain-containing protein [Alphaproteobacteria bacterium]
MDRRLPPAVTEENVPVTVKWFNSSKGFGFVVSPDGGKDIFIHASVLTEHGYNELPDGATLDVDLMETNRGIQVAKVHAVDASTATQGRPGPSGGGFERRPRRNEYENDEPAGPPIDGVVKFYDEGKGYGFIVMDDGSRDVFVSARTVERAGIHTLAPEQRVRVQAKMGPKGPMADRIELI